MNCISFVRRRGLHYALSATLIAGTAFAAASGEERAGVQLPPPNLERDLQRNAHTRQPLRPMSQDSCASFYSALPGTTGDDLVTLLRSADLGCISDLEWVDDARLQHAIAREANVLSVAYALPDLIGAYDGFANAPLINLMRFLQVVEDIHYWCIQTSGTCEDDVWLSSRRWETAWGSAVHLAVFRVVNAFRATPHFGHQSDEHADTLFELTRLIREYEQSADHLDIVVWWLTHWSERYRSDRFKYVMDAMFDMLATGHRSRYEGNERFGPAFGESRDLLEALLKRALESALIGTDWQFIATRSAIELGRFSIYSDTANYVRVREAVDSIRKAYEDDKTFRPVWLRVVAELDYNDARNCANYGTCDWYAGIGFNTNFRREVFQRSHECPASYCPNDRVTVHAQGLDDDQLARACGLLSAVSSTFHPLFNTNCEPVEGDFNDHLDAYVFHDIRSCEDFSSAAFFRNADTCSGIYYERDPADRSTRPYFVATEYEPWESPPDPRLSIWNLEHEYAHYLDGRYNRIGGYRGDLDSLHWWIEGIAEYLAALASPHLGPPPFDASYTLAEILLHSDSLQTRYRHRHLAVRFFMENHRDFVDVAVGHLRRGEFDAYQDFLNGGVARYSEAWGTWLRAGDANVQPEIVQPIQRETPYFLVPMFPAHTEGRRQGWVRVVNLSDRDGDVDIVAVDDGGNRFEPTTLRLGRGAVSFNSHDLENGNAEKGLPQGVGSGTGEWRLELRTALDILVLSYIRTPGFVVPMTDIASRHRGGYLVPTFYPGRNTRQRSSLRIGNLGGADAEVTISGVDDAGIDSSEVKTRIGGFATVTFSAKELEEGARGLDGDLGRGLGKWRLFVSSPNPIFVMSLLESSRGHLVNLSTLPAANDVPGKGTMSFVPTNGAND